MSRAVQVAVLVLVIVAVIVLLFTTVFPWVERTLRQDPTLGAAAPVSYAERPPR